MPKITIHHGGGDAAVTFYGVDAAAEFVGQMDVRELIRREEEIGQAIDPQGLKTLERYFNRRRELGSVSVTTLR